MLRHLLYKIKSTGPITVAEYMKEVLTNPAKVWVGEPEEQAHCGRCARCEPGGVRVDRSPSVLSPDIRGAFQGRSHPQDLGMDKLVSVGQGWSKIAAVPLYR